MACNDLVDRRLIRAILGMWRQGWKVDVEFGKSFGRGQEAYFAAQFGGGGLYDIKSYTAGFRALRGPEEHPE
jgi:hypothetical protein